MRLRKIASHMANLINLENVSKTWGLKTLLDGVSLGVQTGERIGIVGVNGGGKTTLLEVLTGIEPPDAGRVSHTSDLRMAVVTQRFTLDSALTVGQAVVEPLGLQTFEWASNARVREVLQGTGVAELGLDTPVGQLSGGERRRVNLAAALVQDLDLVVLDEPTNHLDHDSIVWLRDFLKAYSGGFIVISHDVELMEMTVNKVLYLDGNRQVIDTYNMGWKNYLLQREQDQARRKREFSNAEKKATHLMEQAPGTGSPRPCPRPAPPRVRTSSARPA